MGADVRRAHPRPHTWATLTTFRSLAINQASSWNRRSMQVKTRIIELDCGWVLVTFQGSKPPAEKRAFWLHRTLTDRQADYPGRFVARTLAVQHNGELVGVHIWLDSAPVSKQQLPIKVHIRLVDTIHSEQLEAFLQHAYRIFLEWPNPPAVAIVNRSRFAVVFDRTSEQGYLIPVDELPADERTAAIIKEWLAAPNSNYFVLEMAGFKRAR